MMPCRITVTDDIVMELLPDEVAAMPRYIIERNAGPLTRDELDAAGRRSNQILAEMDGVTWIRSYVSHADGKIFCEYEAPNAELIREHARRAGLPADAVREIELTISPEMFR
jgi:hypothetical protein